MAHRSMLIAATALVAAVCSPGLAGAATDDQARLDAAIDGFDERMIAAGWVSEGPADGDDEDEADEGDDEGDEAGDAAFAECLGELGAVLEGLDAEEFPGQVASSESDEFTYTPAADGTATTAMFDLDITEETAGAIAASVDDENVGTVAEFIDLMGSKATGDCLSAALEAELAAEEDEGDAPVEFDISVSNEADLGVGDRSVSLEYELSAVFIVPIAFDVEILLAQSGNDIVGVFHAVSGESLSDFDPRAELQLIVDSLDG